MSDQVPGRRPQRTEYVPPSRNGGRPQRDQLADKTKRQHAVWKEGTATGPNALANRWLAERRGQRVRVSYLGGGGVTVEGILVGFDLYSIEIKPALSEATVLIFKGPGSIFEILG